jgi:cytochrome P450
MAFAMQEGIILLANLLRAFRFDLVEGQVVMPQQRVTLRPRGGMKMHVKQRGRAQGAAAENFFANVR